MSPHDEISLVRRAQNGDREALAALWDEITPKLFGYLLNMIQDRAAAEDILQNTWLKAMRALPRYKHRGARIHAWLFAIARNECREHWRRPHSSIPLDEKQHDTPSDAYSTVQEKLLIEQILSSLSEDDREILRLRYIADLSAHGIAQVLNINLVTVRVRIFRALARARRAHALAP